MKTPFSAWWKQVVAAVTVGLTLLINIPVRGDEPVSAADAVKPDTAGTRRALIICGLSGDAEHHKRFSESITKLHAGLTGQLGFAPKDVQVLFGNEPRETDSEVVRSAKRSTRGDLEQTTNGLRGNLRPEDTLWVIVLGHAHFDGKLSSLNLPGPDIHHLDFGKLFAGVDCREQLFVVTTPASGLYAKALSAKGRVIITATESDWETNETEFPHEFARVLSTTPDTKEFDIDQDGTLTVFDLYITVARNLGRSYQESEVLATEHSLLDDNGDGRGTEVQIDYLTVEQGGRVRPDRPVKVTIAPPADGAFSKTIPLKLQAPVVR